MTIAKQSAKKVIDSLPDDTSYDEIPDRNDLAAILTPAPTVPKIIVGGKIDDSFGPVMMVRADVIFAVDCRIFKK